jgi:uncharacterized protein (DUF1499 family)
MARRRLVTEPVSRLAIWSRRLAVFALIVAALAVLIVRSGLLELRPALATFGGALILAVLAILLALAALMVIWREGVRGLGATLAAMVLAFMLLAYPGYLGLTVYRLPWLNDITTDPIDPPRFVTLARARPRQANPIGYAGLYAAEQQRLAYPDVGPIVSDVTPQVAYETALNLVEKRRWLVVDKIPPRTGNRDGHIEAVARTAIMGFRDDIVIRVRANEEGSRIDMRSGSRYGTHDLGTNASRVQGFTEELEEELAAKTPEPSAVPAEPPAPTRRQPAKRR